MHKYSVTPYASVTHILVTISFIVVPLLFLVLFSQLTNLTFVDILRDFSESIFRLGIAYCIALTVAWVLALLFATGKSAHIALPAFDVMQSFPTFALVPLAVLTFGAGTATVIFFLVITIIWPILFSVVNAIKLIKREYWEVVEIYNLRGIDRLRYFLLPASIPGVITGSMIGLGEGWEALIATEIILATNVGLGSFFQENSNNNMVTALGIVLLMLIIFTINRLVWTPLLARVYHKMQE